MKQLTAIVLIGVAGAAVVAGIMAAPLLGQIFPATPDPQPVTQARWLDQNWSTADRHWYHHASQGTSTIPVPYKWFVALEVPRLYLFGEPPLLSGEAYMSRLGFVPSMKGGQAWQRAGFASAADAGEFAGWGDGEVATANPDQLPVGFALTRAYRDPVTGKMLPDQIGLTCAACHTGHLEYKGTSLRIDGANSSASLAKLTSALGGSLLLTDVLPWRFAHFAARVLGPNATQAQKDQLHAELKATIKAALGSAKGEKNEGQEGYNRLDALNRIGNQVFAADLADAKGFDSSVNNATINAPVKYPHLWDSPWFIWAQYDGSIMQPAIRNAGEALGVSARINLVSYDKPQDLWASSVNFKHLGDFEEMLRGPNPLAPKPGGGVAGFSGLLAPKWPADVLGPIDAQLAREGAAVYGQYCQSCHLPPVHGADQAFYSPTNWTTPTAFGEAFLKLKMVDQSYIGTDPAQAEILAKRQVSVPAGLGVESGITKGGIVCFNQPSPKVTTTSFGQALAYVVQKAVEKYVAVYSPPSQPDIALIRAPQDARPNCIQNRVAYKARPLDGIWATPPYLHNGSVPSLEALLSSNPDKDRPKEFCLGNGEYDPGAVGLAVAKPGYFTNTCPWGTFHFSAGKPGNSNRGHEFRDGPRGHGVIGPALSLRQQQAVIAFLKTQ